ncbi:MAG: AAA family ATPase [Campylobacterota bacterium]|nr:AAA family ATPase [Campylobacterota bacterium]
MNLTQNKLRSLYNKKYFDRKNELTDRFDEIGTIVDTFIELKIDNNFINKFGPYSDGITTDSGVKSRQNMINKNIEFVNEMWKLIGGFDESKVQGKYRVISSSIGKKENFFENEDYSTYHRSLWANSNFVSNNYPHQIAKFLQCCKDNKNFDNCIEGSKIVLTWKTDTYLEKGEDDYFTASKSRLETRFPPKFLWMWANKETVLHPISLMAFRNFLNTDFGKQVLKDTELSYTPQVITDMKFDDFIETWKNISDKILKTLELENNPDNIQNLSKLISLISIEETDIKNISDLLQTGNQAVILWGPPGTGKTYESMKVVEELLKAEKHFSNDMIERCYLFSNKGTYNETSISNKKGYYEIVQFHPNYTYQDFIGGISPKLDNDNVSYELREGIFKRFCDTAKDNPKQKYIFIIDEINRAELSAVFGELLYALEYRGKHINLPHFKEPFTIPKNVYIIGTMNNVDKSLVTFDLALRRRFGFFKLMPKLEVIQDVLSESVEEESLTSYYEKCIKLNEDIKDINKLNLGEDYQIGQAYFLKIKDFLEKDENGKLIENQTITSFELEKLWVYHLEPLLEEYLGMSIEEKDIKDKLEQLKKEFIEDN